MSERYPDWWSNTLTLYNRFEDTSTDQVTWYRNTIPNCFWKNISDRIKVGDALLETNNIICRIPKQTNFLEPSLWIVQSAATRASFITLQPGDIIVLGAVTDTINEYQSGYRATDLLDKYKLQGSLRVESLALNAGTGLGQEHYYVRGV